MNRRLQQSFYKTIFYNPPTLIVVGIFLSAAFFSVGYMVLTDGVSSTALAKQTDKQLRTEKKQQKRDKLRSKIKEKKYYGTYKKRQGDRRISNTSSLKVSREEKIRIRKWLKEQNLNRYGDPIDTVYAGGTPLFDELTGKRINRFDYICMQHPDRPWN